MGNTELRTTKPILCDNFSYIEVPYENSIETQNIIKKYSRNTPVIATEFIDYYFVKNKLVFPKI